MAGLSAVGARRSRWRLTLVRDEADPNLPFGELYLTYKDPFYRIEITEW